MEKEVDVTILPGTLDLVFWLVSLVAVIILLLWDVWKAYKRRAFWMPGQALLLSALIIQLLSFIDYSHIRLYSGSSYQTKEVVAILVKNQLVIDSGRLMLCVLIAYLLPEMVRSGSITVWSNLAALALSIIFHVVSELRSIWKMEKRNESLSAFVASSEGFERIFFYLSSTILIVVIIYLLCLLIRAVMVGSRIRGIMSEKISSALLCCPTPRYSWSYDDIKVHVLKCWLVARLCQPDYVFVRTGLCSMAFIFVTVCIGVHVIKLTYLYFTDNESLNSVTKGKLVLFVIVGQCGIVLIGWIFLLFRYMTPRMHGHIFSEKDFETMSIEDALNDLPACLTRLSFRNKRIQEKTIRCLDEKFRNFNSSCRNAWGRVKKFFQFFPSIPVTCPRGTREFSVYQPTLKTLLIAGESELSLWEANQRGFTKVKWYMEQEDDKCCPSELTDLLGLETVTGEGEADREKAEQANKNSWKRTAVSLIHFMINSYNDSDASAIEDASVIERAIQCYIQGWEYMNFVDGLNEEVKSLGRQADKEFDSLQHSWNKRAQPGMLEREIKQPLTELIDQLKSYSDEERRNLQNSRDSTEVAKYCLFETWKVFFLYLSATHLLKRELANVYFVYMKDGVKKAVLQKCRKLAEEGMEEEILDVAILSAKARGLLHKVGKGNDPKDQVELPHNTDEGSTSSPIPTENELGDKGNIGLINRRGAGRIGDNSIGSVGDSSVGSVGHNSVGSVGQNSVGHNSVGSVGHNSVGHNSVGSVGQNSVGHNSVGSVGQNSGDKNVGDKTEIAAAPKDDKPKEE